MNHFYSKKEVIQVSEAYYLKNFRPSATCWLFVEYFNAHNETTDPFQSAMLRGTTIIPTLKRTKYKMYRTSRETDLVNDNSYVETNVVLINNVSAKLYVWDKPTHHKVLKEATKTFIKRLGLKDLTKTFNQEEEYYLIRRYIEYLATTHFAPGSLVVSVCSPPVVVERFQFRAYVPMKGYWVSNPIFDKMSVQRGYNIIIFINDKETEVCHTFMNKDDLDSGIFNTGHTRVCMEGYVVPAIPDHNQEGFWRISRTLQPATTFRLANCVWEVETVNKITKQEHITAHWTVSNNALSALKREEFSKELTEKVFHPDRVARMMGDTWGTDDSWLAQVM